MYLTSRKYTCTADSTSAKAMDSATATSVAGISSSVCTPGHTLKTMETSSRMPIVTTKL